MKLIIDIPNDAYSMIVNTAFTENFEVMFKQSAEDRRKTLQLFTTLDAIKDGKPYEERQRGVWTNIEISVNGYDGQAECSLCGCIIHNNFSNTVNFCPNCGAYMRGGAE